MAQVCLVSGISGSGKTTLAKAVAERCQGALLAVDDYYRETRADELAITNFDTPDLIDADLLANHVRRLIGGEVIQSPVYDYNLCRRVGAQTISPAPVLLIEGQYAACFPALRALAGLSVLVDPNPDLCLHRRVRRDTEERHRTELDVRRRFARQVLPGFLRVQATLREHSTLHLVGEDLEMNIRMVVGALTGGGVGL